MCCKIPIIKGRTKKDLLIQKEKIENIDPWPIHVSLQPGRGQRLL